MTIGNWQWQCDGIDETDEVMTNDDDNGIEPLIDYCWPIIGNDLLLVISDDSDSGSDTWRRDIDDERKVTWRGIDSSIINDCRLTC